MLDCREADVDVIFVDTLEIVNLCYLDLFPFKIDVLAEEVLRCARVEEIIFRFFNDIGGVDEKEEVAVAFLIEIKDQACHDERFTAAGRHVEQKVERFPFTGEIVFKTEEKTRERLFLIGTEFKRGVEVIGEIRWNFGV